MQLKTSDRKLRASRDEGSMGPKSLDDTCRCVREERADPALVLGVHEHREVLVDKRAWLMVRVMGLGCKVEGCGLKFWFGG